MPENSNTGVLVALLGFGAVVVALVMGRGSSSSLPAGADVIRSSQSGVNSGLVEQLQQAVRPPSSTSTSTSTSTTSSTSATPELEQHNDVILGDTTDEFNTLADHIQKGATFDDVFGVKS